MTRTRPAKAPFLRSPFVESFAFTSALFVAGFSLVRPFFDTNDNIALTLMSKGIGVTQHPTEFLVFINVLIGLVLKNLFTLFPHLQWYGLFLFSVLFLSTWALAAAFQSAVRTKWRAILFLSLFLPVFFRYFTWPDYTLAALFSAQAGILLFINPAKPEKLSWIFGCCLLLLSSLIRMETCLFTLFISIPMVYGSLKESKVSKGTRLSILALTLALVAAAHFLDSVYYQERPAWNEARQYVSAHNRLAEYQMPDYAKERAVFQSAGWSPVDFDMFVGWYWRDGKFDLATLRKISAALPPFHLGKIGWEIHALTLSSGAVPAGAAFCLLLFLAPGGKRKRLLGTAGWFFFSILLLALFEKIPDRILLSQLFYLNLASLYEALPGVPGNIPRDRVRTVRLTVLLALFGIACVFIGRDYVKNQRRQLAEEPLMESLRALNPKSGQLFVVWDSQFPFEALSALNGCDAFKGMNLVWLSWIQRLPITEESLSRFAAREDLLEAMSRRKDLFLIFNPGNTPFFPPYMLERYGLKVSCRQVFKGFLYNVYQVVRE